MREGVDRAQVAVGPALPRAGQHVRRPAHRLLPAGDDDLGVAEPDRPGGVGDRGQPGQADLVDRDGGHPPRDPGGDRGLPGGVLPGAGLQHLAEDHLVHLLAGDPGPLERGPDRGGPELDAAVSDDSAPLRRRSASGRRRR